MRSGRSPLNCFTSPRISSTAAFAVIARRRRALPAARARSREAGHRRGGRRGEPRRRGNPSHLTGRARDDRRAGRNAPAAPANDRCARPRARRDRRAPAARSAGRSPRSRDARATRCRRAAWMVSMTPAAGMPLRGMKAGPSRPSSRANASLRSVAMAGRDERIGDRRPADAAAAARGVRDQRLHVQPIAEHAEPRADLPDAPHPVGALRAQEARPATRSPDRGNSRAREGRCPFSTAVISIPATTRTPRSCPASRASASPPTVS